MINQLKITKYSNWSLPGNVTISGTTNLKCRRNLFNRFHEPFISIPLPRPTVRTIYLGSRNPSFESIFAVVRTVQLAVFGCISIAADSSISPDKFCWFSIVAKHAIIPPMLKWVQKRLYNVLCKRVLIIKYCTSQYCTSQYESHLISLQTVPVTMKKNVNSWKTFFGWFQTKIYVSGSIYETKFGKLGESFRRAKELRWPGIEPGSNAWKASMLTITPPTLVTLASK